MEFRYANISPEQESEAGGNMEFARLTNGAWAISRWNIRMPLIEERVRSQSFGGSGAHIAEIRVSGGDLALARRGNDTLWSRPPLVLSGTVLDSTSGKSIAGARVAIAGTSLAGTADDRGRFTIAGVLPGQYTVEIHTASLDSVSAVHQSPLTFIDARKGRRAARPERAAGWRTPVRQSPTRSRGHRARPRLGARGFASTSTREGRGGVDGDLAARERPERHVEQHALSRRRRATHTARSASAVSR